MSPFYALRLDSQWLECHCQTPLINYLLPVWRLRWISSKNVSFMKCSAGFLMHCERHKKPQMSPSSHREINTANWSVEVRNQGIGWSALPGSQLSGSGFSSSVAWTWLYMWDSIESWILGGCSRCCVLQMLKISLQRATTEAVTLLIVLCPIDSLPAKRWSGGIIREMKLAAEMDDTLSKEKLSGTMGTTPMFYCSAYN